MKKILSVVLVLAMVISCLAMVHVLAEPAEEFYGFKLVGNASGYSHSRVGEGNFTATDMVDGVVSDTITVYNPNDYTVSIAFYYQNGWATMVNDQLVKDFYKGVDILAHDKVTLTISAKYVDGKIPYGTSEEANDISKLTIRFDTNTIKEGDYIVVQAESADDQIMKLAPDGGCIFKKEALTEYTCDFPAKTVVNGDVENGSTGWGVLKATNCGSFAVVADPDDADNKVAHFSNLSTIWDSIAFDLGAAVINDPDHFYAGGGAGNYKLTFRARAVDGKGGLFDVYLNSQNHLEASKIKTDILKDEDANVVRTFFNAGTIKMTDEWQEFEVEVKVEQSWLDTLKLIRDIYCNDANKATDTYNVALRLDGSLGAFASNDSFGYYVDDVTIEKIVATPTPEATATPEATPTPVPVKKVENGNAENGMTNWGNIHGGSVALVQPGANNTGNAVKATIAGKYQSIAFDLGPAIIQDAENGYQGAGAGVYTVSFYAKASDGNEGKFAMVLNSVCHLSASQIESLNLGLTATENTYYTGEFIELTDEWEKYTVKFELSETYVKEMNALYRSSHSLASSAYQIVLRFDGSPVGCAFENNEYFDYFVDEVTIEAPEAADPNAPVKVPTGVIFEATEDTTLGYYTTATTGGAVSAADIKGGEVTKFLYIENLSDEDMAIYFPLQARVEPDGSAVWADPDDYAPESWDIPAGEIVKVEYTFAVNDDGTVTIRDIDVPVEKLFYRINFTTSEFVEGSKFVIYGDETQVALFNAGLKAGWSKTLTYDVPKTDDATKPDGDFAPVALIATVAVAFVALTVVVAKKRED